MKSLTQLCMVGLVGTGVWWFVAQKTGLPSPAALVKPIPVDLHEHFAVKANEVMRITFNVPSGRTPGVLHGTWTSRGVSAGILGATDDTLVSFTLRGPNNEIVQQSDHDASGNFSVRVTTPGTYTFLFNNGGIVRSSSRTVDLDGQFAPD